MPGTRSSAQFLFGMVLLCVVTVVASFWRPGGSESDEKPVLKSRSAEPLTFQYTTYPQDHDRSDFSEQGLQVELASLSRQMHRRARMERDGVQARIIDNPDMPEEIRSRFRAEKERLDLLASSYPELAGQAQEALPKDRRFSEDGSVTPEFAEVLRMMKSSGDAFDVSESYVQQLEMRAEDPDTPASSRPTQEDIERARKEMHIPLL